MRYNYRRATTRADISEALAIFAEQDRLVRDPFYAMHEKKLAELAKERKVWMFRNGYAIVAVAVMQRTRAKVPVLGFGGDLLLTLPRQSWQIKRIAFSKPKPTLGFMDMMRDILSRAPNVVLEAPIDDGWSMQFAAALRLSRVTSKVTAFGDIIAVNTVNIRRCGIGVSDRAYLAEHATGVQLVHPRMHGGRFPVSELRRKLQSDMMGWADHYSNYNEKQSWSAVCLRSFGGDPNFIIKPECMPKAWKRNNANKLDLKIKNTPLMHTYRKHVRLILEAIPGRKERIRFMRLAPGGGKLGRHTDKKDKTLGLKTGQIARLHVPIITNNAVWFTSWALDGTEHEFQMRAGELWYLDIRKPHMAVNDGKKDRIHLVIDVESSPKLVDIIKAGYDAA